MVIRYEAEQSAWNMAAEYLKGIKMSLDRCKECAMRFDIDGWVSWLRCAYREASVKFKDTEMEVFENMFKEIWTLTNDKKNRRNNQSQIMFRLDILEIRIRRTIQAKGMLLPSKEDAMFAVLKR